MTGGYAAALVQSIVALAGVCALAAVLLKMAAGRGLGRVPRGKRLELVERLPLDARSAVCVVRAGERTLLLGTSEGSAPTLITELPTLPEQEVVAPAPSFRSLLKGGAAQDRSVDVKS